MESSKEADIDAQQWVDADTPDVQGEAPLVSEKKVPRVVKGVRFNLEQDSNEPQTSEPTTSDHSERSTRAVRFIQEIQPCGGQRKLFNSEDSSASCQLDNSSTTEGQSKEVTEMEQTKQWLLSNFARDVRAAKSRGARPIELKVKNFILLRQEDNSIRNRVEFNSNFDFATVEQILISPEESHPTQTSLKYAMIVLFGRNKNTPLVFPYCYLKQTIEDFETQIDSDLNRKDKKKLKRKLKKTIGNSANELDNWIFVNSFMKEAMHKVNSFSNV